MNEEALRLAPGLKHAVVFLRTNGFEKSALAIEYQLRFLPDDTNALSTRSCSECAEFKRMKAELAQSEKSGESVAEDASECIVALQAMTERAEAAERKLADQANASTR